jgi:hypothetical protein
VLWKQAPCSEICGHYASKIRAKNGQGSEAKPLRINNIVSGESSPEKAGVGGSIPSLATMFSTT